MRPTSSDCQLRVFFSAVGAVFHRIVQNLELRLHDLQAIVTARCRLHLAVQRHQLSRRETCPADTSR